MYILLLYILYHYICYRCIAMSGGYYIIRCCIHVRSFESVSWFTAGKHAGILIGKAQNNEICVTANGVSGDACGRHFK